MGNFYAPISNMNQRVLLLLMVAPNCKSASLIHLKCLLELLLY